MCWCSTRTRVRTGFGICALILSAETVSAIVVQSRRFDSTKGSLVHANNDIDDPNN
jgi:hypothetical protein